MKNIFLTGVTGFVGKVVLEELVRRRAELGFEKIFVLIRPGRKGESAGQRFEKEVADSPCFAGMPEGWHRIIHIVEGELTHLECGLLEADRDHLAREVTHIINCAASVRSEEHTS